MNVDFFSTIGMYLRQGQGIGYMILTGVFAGLSFFVSNMLKSRFRKFSAMPIDLSGQEIAQQMLDDAGIGDVKIMSTPGQLTDHYNPANKTVNLSDVVYSERNVAAAAVAAHEVGHAIQHSRSYKWLKMRSNLVPVLGIGSRFAPFIIMIGLSLMTAEGLSGVGSIATMLGIILFSATTLFSFVTLPVEFDASKRALNWFIDAGVMGGLEHSKAKSALNAAAMTYVVGALTSLGQLVYFILRYMSRKSR